MDQVIALFGTLVGVVMAIVCDKSKKTVGAIIIVVCLVFACASLVFKPVDIITGNTTPPYTTMKPEQATLPAFIAPSTPVSKETIMGYEEDQLVQVTNVSMNKDFYIASAMNGGAFGPAAVLTIQNKSDRAVKDCEIRAC